MATSAGRESAPAPTAFESPAWAAARPALSILIPSFRDDPQRLLGALDRPDLPVEIVLIDDGSGDPQLVSRLACAVLRLAAPARFLALPANEGRARVRNRLARAARASNLLFLDADMLPDRPDFLDRWLALVSTQGPPAAFGGFSLDQAPLDPAHAVHRRMALRGDCAPPEVRRRAPEKHVFTSNLLVRRDVFEAAPFDNGFRGWGWEDVEWAARVVRTHPILHVDIPATHLGLDTACAMATKFEQSAANFGRLAAAHPDLVQTYPLYKAARFLKAFPLRRLWRPWLKAAAVSDIPPATLRALALRLYRAALYAETI
ncbi:MAG: glycosyltransferase [Caulobacteraceae bacterium]|nr:glycosyltransferase [Caulobacteraceae bacterium]